MINPEVIGQPADQTGINTSDALNLLVKYLPQLVDKASSAGIIDKEVDLTALVSQSTH